MFALLQNGCKIKKKIKNYCDMALLQTGCLGVPEFLHQLQLQTQVGNGGRKRKMGEKKREKKKKNGRKQRENIKKNGRKQCNKEKER